MADELTIEYMAVSEMMSCRHPKNPKEHNIGQLTYLFNNHGFGSPGTIDERTGLFLCGHGRAETLNSMKRQKMKPPRYVIAKDDDWYAPVTRGYHSESDELALAYLAADNQSTISGGWNEPALAELLQKIANSNVPLKTTGFDADELDNLFRDLNPANHIEFPEYDESLEGEVQYCECPNCGHKFPK